MGDTEEQDGYYNNPAEQPEVPDVAILHCGIMPHMKMGIKLNNFKNFEDGISGRILSYNDLSDRKNFIQEKKENEDSDDEDVEIKEARRLVEENERKKKEAEEEERKLKEQQEEEERVRLEIEKEQKALEKERRGSKDTLAVDDIFKHANNKNRRGSRRKSVDPGRVIYGRKDKEEVQINQNSLGGEYITVEDAIKLKTLCWGGSKSIIRPEWSRAGLIFHPALTAQSYGLHVGKGSSKPFLLILQAHVLKQLLFHGKAAKKSQKKMKKNDTEENLLKPTKQCQKEILIGAVSEILWKCGDKKQAALCVASTKTVLDPTPLLLFDGVTERMHLFECNTEEELKNCVKQHIHLFMEEKSPGLVNLLYSIILSKEKGVDSVRQDMQDEGGPCLVEEDKISMSLANLMLTGYATPFLFNGSIFDREELKKKTGIIDRNDIGLLIWDKTLEETAKLNVGSRYKTPNLPVWVSCVNGNWGVLFNPNKDLLKSHSAENRFQLYYYSNHISKDRSETLLTIDSRSSNIKNNFDDDTEDFDNECIDPLEKAIQTKWSGVSVDWRGIQPYV